jgi:arsenite methyltransferase
LKQLNQPYGQLLTSAGFTDIEVEVTRRFGLQDIAESGARALLTTLSDSERADVDG